MSLHLLRFQEKQRFLTDVLHEVMLLDGLASSHPISQEVYQAADIDRVFDWIAYKKASDDPPSFLLASACPGFLCEGKWWGGQQGLLIQKLSVWL